MAKKSRHTILSVDFPGSPSDVLRRPDATASELREALIESVGDATYWRKQSAMYEGIARKNFDQASSRIRREETVVWTERQCFAAILEEDDERVPAEHVLQRAREWLARLMVDKPLEVLEAEMADTPEQIYSVNKE